MRRGFLDRSYIRWRRQGTESRVKNECSEKFGNGKGNGRTMGLSGGKRSYDVEERNQRVDRLLSGYLTYIDLRESV